MLQYDHINKNHSSVRDGNIAITATINLYPVGVESHGDVIRAIGEVFAEIEGKYPITTEIVSGMLSRASRGSYTLSEAYPLKSIEAARFGSESNFGSDFTIKWAGKFGTKREPSIHIAQQASWGVGTIYRAVTGDTSATSSDTVAKNVKDATKETLEERKKDLQVAADKVKKGLAFNVAPWLLLIGVIFIATKTATSKVVDKATGG